MRNSKLLTLLLACFLVFTGCAVKASVSAGDSSGPGTSQGKATHNGGQPGDNEPGNGEQSGNGLLKNIGDSPKECDWTIKVSDTQKGSLPVNGKQIKAEVTLELVAWKDGSADVLGEYTGEGYIKVVMDFSGLTGGEYAYTGGGAQNRQCESLQFRVEPYDSGKYEKSLPKMTGKIFTIPKGDFNAMSISRSDWWEPAVNTDFQVYDEGSLVANEQLDVTDTQNIDLGINFLVEGASVTVQIPTYEFAWNIAPFKGTVTGVPAGTGKREKLEMPASEGDGSNDAGGGASSSGEGNTWDPDVIGQNGDYFDGRIKDKNGNIGYDTDGDGIADYFVDDNGNMSYDTDADGEIDSRSYTDDNGDTYKDNNNDGIYEEIYYSDGRIGTDTNGDGKPEEVYTPDYGDGGDDFD